MQWTLVLSAATLIMAVQEEDECMPLPSDKHVYPWECCKLSSVIPDTFKDNVLKCIENFPITKASGLPAPGAKLSTEVKNTVVCATECVFTESNMLTPDKKLDKAAITERIAAVNSNNDLAPLINSIIDKCFAAATSDADQSLDCKSGAKEFEQCLITEFFLNCPKSFWTENAYCTALKGKVSKCPNIPIMLIPPRPH